MSTKVNDWIPLQIKVFTRWVNGQLKNNNCPGIEEITKDLSNGVPLVELAQILTKKDAPVKWAKQPKRNIDSVMNCDLSVDMFTKDGVKLIGIPVKISMITTKNLFLVSYGHLFYTIQLETQLPMTKTTTQPKNQQRMLFLNGQLDELQNIQMLISLLHIQLQCVHF